MTANSYTARAGVPSMQTPKFNLGQTVVVVHTREVRTYPPCGTCDGSGTIIVPKHGPTTCPTCKGDKHASGPSTVRKVKEIAGTLTIRHRISEDYLYEDRWQRSGVSYQGIMDFEPNMSEDDRRWNLFREEVCFGTRAEAEAWIKAGA